MLATTEPWSFHATSPIRAGHFSQTNTPSKGPNMDGREQNEHGCGAVPIAVKCTARLNVSSNDGIDGRT